MAELYKYRARDYTGKIVEGTIEADSSQLAMTQLRSQNLIVTKVEKTKAGAPSFDFNNIFGGAKVTTKELAIFSRQFATMIDAGVPLLRSLNIIQEQAENKALKEALILSMKDLERGLTLSESFGNQPRIFPLMYVNMIEAGEVGGVLDEVLERMADHFEKEDDTREKIKSALTYPTVVFSMAILAVIFMLMFVLPSFISMYDGMDLELPTATKIVIGISDGLRAYWFVFLGLIILGVLGVKRILSTDKGRYTWDSYLLKIPILGPLQKKVTISRFSRTLGTLLRSGVPIITALEVVRKTSNNAVVAASIENAKNNVRDGRGLSEPLRDSTVFTQMSVHMMAVGEETGELDTMLEKVAFFYDREVDAAVSKLSSSLEPIIMVFIGVVIGGIVIAFMLPMVKIFGAI